MSLTRNIITGRLKNGELNVDIVMFLSGEVLIIFYAIRVVAIA